MDNFSKLERLIRGGIYIDPLMVRFSIMLQLLPLVAFWLSVKLVSDSELLRSKLGYSQVTSVEKGHYIMEFLE